MPIQSLTAFRVDFDFTNPCYVLKLAASASHDALVVAALSNNTIKVYQHSQADLHHVVDLQGHADTITDISVPSPHTVLSSSTDGSVRLWDVKSSQFERYDADDEVFSCSCSDNVLVAGANGTLHFWDRRTRQKLAELADTHMDIVTVARFHPQQRSVLVSASDDGLMAVFDFSNGINEDDAFVGGQNVSNSPLELDFYGQALDKLWCRSASETLHLWHWSQAVTEDDQPSEAANVLTAREQLTAAAGDRLPLIGEQVDMLVGCHYEPAEDQLYVAAGSNCGPLGIFPVRPQGGEQLFGAPVALLTGVHTELVRSILFRHSMIVTGGEDARISVWGDAGALEREMLATLRPPVERASLPSSRHSPY